MKADDLIAIQNLLVGKNGKVQDSGEPIDFKILDIQKMVNEDGEEYIEIITNQSMSLQFSERYTNITQDIENHSIIISLGQISTATIYL